MPFFANSGQNRRRKKTAAYHLPARLEDLFGCIPPQTDCIEDWSTENILPAKQPSNMGRRSQKPLQGTPSKTPNIMAMLQRQALHKIAAPEHQEAPADLSPDHPQAHTLLHTPETTTAGPPDLSALATKQDIKNYLTELHQTLATDIAVIQADLQAVIDRVRATEEDILEPPWLGALSARAGPNSFSSNTNIPYNLHLTTEAAPKLRHPQTSTCKDPSSHLATRPLLAATKQLTRVGGDTGGHWIYQSNRLTFPLTHSTAL
ncbi:Hypothetical predicted protein [Pelobates cultripes]|uniref:Uncharacterized protein n=1 Tax=Pelobates cultripes TaxID=61616 RepID=A0AAD1R0U9_PELCU|nr:Hypothetical predicted protein [Pelobates cultripes]